MPSRSTSVWPGLRRFLGRALHPHGGPHRRQLGMAQDQGGAVVGLLLRRSVVEPGVDHALVERDHVGVLGTGLGVEQDQAPHPVGGQQGGPQGEEPALGHPAHHGPLDPQVVHQGEAVTGRVPVGEGPFVVDGVAEATRVPRDDPVVVAQGRHLVVEHGPVHQEAVGEHHHRPVAAGVVECDRGPVDVCRRPYGLDCRHVNSSAARGRTLRSDRAGIASSDGPAVGTPAGPGRPEGSYRLARGSPSPIHEMMSRWISLVPPPKVKIVWPRARCSRWPRSTAPGDPSAR